MKDPYVSEHLGHVRRAAERDVEQAVMGRLQDTVLELGRGMAFVGRRVRLTVPDDASSHVDEFCVDLLFFHVEQLRYVDVELKIGRFERTCGARVGLCSGEVMAPGGQPLEPCSGARDIGTRPIGRHVTRKTGHPISVRQAAGSPVSRGPTR